MPATAAGTQGNIVVRATDPQGLYTVSPPCAVTVQAGGWEITEAFSSTTLGALGGTAGYSWYDDTSIALGTMPTTGGSCYQVSWLNLDEGQPTTPAPRQGASRIQFTDSDEIWLSARVAISSTVRNNHLFYFKLSSADQWESPTAGGALYIETRDSATNGQGRLDIYSRREDGTWLGGWQGTANIADGAAHELVVRLVLNTAGQANGIIQAWVDGVLQVNASNWQYRTQATSRLRQFLLGPYRQDYLTNTGSIWVDNISLSNTGTAPQTGTTYFAWNCDSEAVQTPAHAAPSIAVFSGTDLGFSDGGRTCMRTSLIGVDGGNTGNRGIEPYGMPLDIGTYGSTIFLRWWMRFDNAFTWGTNPAAKVKMFRFATSSAGDLNTLYYARNNLNFEFDGQAVAYPFAPESDSSLFGWNEFVVELRVQSSGQSNGYIRLYRNGVKVGESLNRSFTVVSNGRVYAGWGGPCTRTYPQLYSTSGGGGYVYYDEQALTNFWSSAYPQGT